VDQKECFEKGKSPSKALSARSRILKKANEDKSGTNPVKRFPFRRLNTYKHKSEVGINVFTETERSNCKLLTECPDL